MNLSRLIAWRRRRSSAALAITLAIALASPRVVLAQGDARQRAMSHDAAARRLFNLGKFEAAIDLYEKAYQASPLPLFLYNLAQCYTRLGTRESLKKAAHHFSSYLRTEPKARNRAAVERKIAELRAKISVMMRPGHASGVQPLVVDRRILLRLPMVERRESLFGLWLTGAINFAAWYLLTVGLAVGVSDSDKRARTVGLAAVPLAGPFLIGSDDELISKTGEKAAAAVVGSLQVISVVLFVIGISVKRTVRVPQVETSVGDTRLQLSVLPSGPAGSLGLSASLVAF